MEQAGRRDDPKLTPPSAEPVRQSIHRHAAATAHYRSTSISSVQQPERRQRTVTAAPPLPAATAAATAATAAAPLTKPIGGNRR